MTSSLCSRDEAPARVSCFGTTSHHGEAICTQRPLDVWDGICSSRHDGELACYLHRYYVGIFMRSRLSMFNGTKW